MLGDLSDADGSIFSDKVIRIFEAVQNFGEDVVIDNNFSKVDGVLGDVCKARGDLSLELTILVVDQLSQKWDSSRIDHKLGQFWGMLTNFTQG